MVEGRIN